MSEPAKRVSFAIPSPATKIPTAEQNSLPRKLSLSDIQALAKNTQAKSGDKNVDMRQVPSTQKQLDVKININEKPEEPRSPTTGLSDTDRFFF